MDTWYWVEWKGNWYPVNNVTDLPATRAGGKRCRVEYIAPEDQQLQCDIVARADLVSWQDGLDQQFDLTSQQRRSPGTCNASKRVTGKPGKKEARTPQDCRPACLQGRDKGGG